MHAKMLTRLPLAAACGLAAVAVAAPAAQAQYPDPLYPTTHDQQCENAINVVKGVGASFQRTAQLAWGARIIAPDPANPLASGFGYDAAGCTAFKLAGDGGTKRIEYAPSGSGAGRAAFGATDAAGSARNLTIDFGGTDDAPTPTQVANANEGPSVNPAADADDGVLHTIPIAQGAVAVNARVPDGCELSAAGRQLARNRVEGFYRGLAAFDTWKELIGVNITASPGLGQTDASCQAKKPARVVRFDNSGTTNIFKRYLQKAAAGGFDWREPADGGTLANNAWPSATVNAGVAGNGPALDTLKAQGTNGGIGYGDLGGSRGRGFGWDYFFGQVVQNDRTVWLRIQRIANTAYISPAKVNDQVGTKGAACTNVTYANQPANTKGSWQDTAAVETTTDYPICGLTYALAWQSPKAVGITSTARAVGRRDYIGYQLDRPGLGTTPAPAGCTVPNSSYGKGQCKLPAADYAVLPSDVFAKARAGMVQLDN